MDTFQYVQYIIYNVVLKAPKQDPARKASLFNFQIIVVQQTWLRQNISVITFSYNTEFLQL